MNFGLDLRPSLSRPTGVGAYVTALASRLPGLAADDRFHFFSASLRDHYPIRDWPANVRLHDFRIPVSALNFAWNRHAWPPLDLLIRSPLDVVHSPHPLIIPARRAKRIVTIHDLFFYKHPELTRAEVRRDYVPLVRQHVAQADGVICVSQYTADEARLLLGVPPEKIAVIPNGIDPSYRETPDEAAVGRVLSRHRLPPGPLLFIGSDEKRKNLVNLAMAYLGLARRRRIPPLVLIGPGSNWTRRSGRDGPQIRAVGYLDTHEIRALMASATALVLPSLEEGFGLPVVEAMAAGLPVVCSRGSALEEVAGDDAVLVNPLDTASIAAGIVKILDDRGLAADLAARGRKRSQRYDWDTAAAATLEFYRRTAAA